MIRFVSKIFPVKLMDELNTIASSEGVTVIDLVWRFVDNYKANN